MRLRLSTAGESHGPALCGILDGLPHGVPLDKAAIDDDLKRRQGGYGRGGRMKIERDQIEVVAGVRGGKTLGSPLAFLVRNLDHDAWTDTMSPFGEVAVGKALTRPRPGHADLAGALRFEITDARDVLERASARSTAIRVAAGAICKALLREAGIDLMCHVVAIGDVAVTPTGTPRELRTRAEQSDVRCADDKGSLEMIAAIKAAQKEGDSLGGVAEVVAWGVPPGLGSHAEWDARLDGRLAQALLSIQSVKGVELGLGFEAARRRGSQVHDPIAYDGAFQRPTNHAGGIEGGITNGEPVIVRVAFKPIPTLARALASVDLASKEAFSAQKERTDSCAVPAGAVIAEAAVAFVLADALLDKTGGDSLAEVLRNLKGHVDAVARL
jgi:chorismate synthase